MFKNTDFTSYIRTVLATLFFVSGIAWVRSVIIRRKMPLVRFLLIHHVKNPQKFEKIIKFLDKNYNIISFEDFKTKNFSLSKTNILLTMDDGYETWISRALPVLEKYGAPILFFVSSGFLLSGKDINSKINFCKNNLKLDWISDPLNNDSLNIAKKHSLVTFGGHSKSHYFLTSLNDDILYNEVCEDKIILEKLAGKKIDVFAYPFGNYNERVKKCIDRAGYLYAVTTDSNFFSAASDLLSIPRSNHGTVSLMVLKMWVEGAFDLVFILENFIRKYIINFFRK